MADFNPLSANPETIRAYNDTLKIAVSALSSLLVGLGALFTYLSKKTEKTTKDNTVATTVNTKALAIHSQEMKEIKDAALKEQCAFEARMNVISDNLFGEMKKIKIVVAKVSADSEQKLSLIPKIQDRLESLEKISNRTLAALKQGLEKGKKE